MKPVIFGLSGLTLTADERALFRECMPAGYILFAHNIQDRDQLRKLTNDVRALHGRDDVAILIDQEGGRVSRMKPPMWVESPAAAAFDALYDVSPLSAIEAARSNAEAVALMLAEVGVTVNCMPVLDVRGAQTHGAIGDRALGSDSMRVAALGRAVLDGLKAGGVVGVVKHMPGQGRAIVDSHYELPVVTSSKEELEHDLFAFRRLKNAPMGMTGHVVFPAYDAQRPATLSPIIIEQVIRGDIGFDGLLMSDDLKMQSLSGDAPALAMQCIEAGCDVVLNCWSAFEEKVQIVERLPDITERARKRLDAAMSSVEIMDFVHERFETLIAKRDALLAFANAGSKLTHAATGAA
jgi:beta-N-acetylhexosaminidase